MSEDPVRDFLVAQANHQHEIAEAAAELLRRYDAMDDTTAYHARVQQLRVERSNLGVVR